MDKWADKVVPELMKHASEDAYYRSIPEKCKVAETEYMRIMNNLPARERGQLEENIALCEELLFQFARLAYYYGVCEECMGKKWKRRQAKAWRLAAVEISA